MQENDRQAYFNRLAADWDSFPKMGGSDEKVLRYVKQSTSGAPRRILDLGCGTGILLDALLDSASGLECVIELDFALDMLRANAKKFADKRVRRVCADALRLPVASSSFDLVLCFGILPHLEDQEEALAELLRVVRPGGAVTVGHLVGSRELNAFHGSLSGPVAGDLLAASAALAEKLSEAGAVHIQAEENADWYFLYAEKPER
jgi:ubiquinone/menaquinone biosynthesis C-methylase UbiE